MINHAIALDMRKRPGTVPPRVTVRRGEARTQKVTATVTDDGASYTSAYDAARLCLLHADGTWARVSATKGDGTVWATLDSAALNGAGRCRLAYFEFYSSASAYSETTQGFELVIEGNVDGNGSAEAQSYDDELSSLYRKWSALESKAEKAEAARATAEEARATAEEARASAETARASAESARKSNETARKSAETSRASAEAARASAEEVRESASAAAVASAESATKAAKAATATIDEFADRCSALEAHFTGDAFAVSAGGTGATTGAGAVASLAGGDELVANPLDGTSSTGWSTAAEECTVSKSGVTFKGAWGTSSAVAYKTCNATLTSAASGTAAYARSIDVSATVRVNAASTDAGSASARVSVRYVADGATATSTLTPAQLYLDGATAGTRALAGRVTLPAGATIKDVQVSVTGYGGTADVTFSQVHAKIAACGLGGDNLMTGTAGFSTLSGGTWANGGLSSAGTGTLAAASSDGTPVPESACVALAGTAAGERMQLHQQDWSCAAGEELTVSCWAKASAAGGRAQLMAFGSAAGGTARGWYVGTSWTRLTYTQTTTAASDSTPIGVVQWYPKAAGDKLYVCGLKVERGGVASAWSPNPCTPVYGAQHKTYLGMYLTKNLSEYEALSTSTWTKMGVVFRCNS